MNPKVVHSLVDGFAGGVGAVSAASLAGAGWFSLSAYPIGGTAILLASMLLRQWAEENPRASQPDQDHPPPENNLDI